MVPSQPTPDTRHQIPDLRSQRPGLCRPSSRFHSTAETRQDGHGEDSTTSIFDHLHSPLPSSSPFAWPACRMNRESIKVVVDNPSRLDRTINHCGLLDLNVEVLVGDLRSRNHCLPKLALLDYATLGVVQASTYS